MSFLSNVVRLLEQIDPDQRGAATVTSGWHQVESSHPFFAIVNVGEMAAGATLDCKLEQAQDASGTGAKDLKTATQLTDTDDSKAIIFDAILADIDTGNSFTHVRLSVTVAVANVDYSACLGDYWLGVMPASMANAAFVDEVV